MIQRGAVSLGRVNEILQTEPEIRSPAVPKAPADNVAPLIQIRALDFIFDEGETPAKTGERAKALEGINLTIEKGTVTGVLGRTGSGKSTLIKAITRVIDPPPGTVFIKGIEAAAWDLTELRKLFSVTPQDSYLFSDSIKNNILYSLGEINGEAEKNANRTAANAASLAALEKDFCGFSAGWDTVIGEKGLTLSGGQKQRTAIARALAAVLADGRQILVLDDSLSAVDAETERAILDGLFELIDERKNNESPLTAIIVSHRISTLGYCDNVIVLDKGKIIERGSPVELAAATGGFYSRTAALQSLGLSGSDYGGGRG
jgi:ATP-binding cassette subfamily B protein